MPKCAELGNNSVSHVAALYTKKNVHTKNALYL